MPQTAPHSASAPASSPHPLALAEIPKVRTDLAPIGAAARALRDSILPELPHPRVDPGAKEGLSALSLSAADALGVIHSSERAFSALADYLKTLNELGAPRSQGRLGVTVRSLLPIAVKQISDRMENADKMESGETRLLGVYVRKHQVRPAAASPAQSAPADGAAPQAAPAEEQSVQIVAPDWFLISEPYLSMVGSMPDLPGPAAYLAQSTAPAADFAVKNERLQQLFLDEPRKRSEWGPDSKDYEAYRKLIDDIENEFDARLGDLHDIDAAYVPEVASALNVSAVMNKECVGALLTLHESLAKLLMWGSGAVKPADAGVALPIDLPQFTVADDGTRPLARIRFDARALIGPETDPRTLAAVAERYVRTRELLDGVLNSWQLNFPLDEGRKPLIAAMRKALERLVPAENDVATKTVGELFASQDAAVRGCAARLVTQPIRALDDRGREKTALVLEQPESVRLAGKVVDALVRGPAPAAQELVRALESTPIKPLISHPMRIRDAVDRGEILKVCASVDAECLRLTQTKLRVSPYEQQAFLFTLLALSEDDKLRRHLKGNFHEHLKRISEIAGKLTEGFPKTETGRAAGKVIEDARAEIQHRFAFTLKDDFWGQERAVQEITSRIDRNLLILRYPRAAEGCPLNQALMNGFLLFGDPGVGKSYLAECLANYYKLPLLPISREEMQMAFEESRQKGSPAAATGMGRSFGSESGSAAAAAPVSLPDDKLFTSYIQRKVVEAERLMKESKKDAVFFLIDELEAEAFRRDHPKATPVQIGRTNEMLRVVAHQLRVHPHIILMACTNHIDMVDAAAMRVGRLYHVVELKLPNLDETKVILSHVFEKQGIDALARDEEAFGALAKACHGLTPEGIINTVTHHCCFSRAQALAEGKEPRVALTLNDLSRAMEETKSIGRRRWLETQSPAPAEE